MLSLDDFVFGVGLVRQYSSSSFLDELLSGIVYEFRTSLNNVFLRFSISYALYSTWSPLSSGYVINKYFIMYVSILFVRFNGCFCFGFAP